jgi:hypothetical protein
LGKQSKRYNCSHHDHEQPAHVISKFHDKII